METESRREVSSGWGRGEGSYCLMGTEFQFCEMRRVPEMDGGDDCRTTM